MRRHAIALVAMLLASAPPVAAGERAFTPHFRAASAEALALVHDGEQRSPSFNQLLRALEETDLVIYIQLDPRLRRVGGSISFVGASGGLRYVSIRISSWIARDRQVAMLGHELYHAFEVAQRAEVRDRASMRALYERIGMRRGRYIDTTAARSFTGVVLDELRGRGLAADLAPLETHTDIR
jgi:hypothetical protein